MVEMTETARILHHATERSLVVLDEIGRGTSTLDGLSLAWAIAETLAAGSGTGVPPVLKDCGPRTLFATHYHELTRLEEMMPGRVRNLHVSVREWGDEIVFLHRILPGKTDRSYGIHVAKLAGMPAGTVARAREVLESLAVHQAEVGEGQVLGAEVLGPGPGEAAEVRAAVNRRANHAAASVPMRHAFRREARPTNSRCSRSLFSIRRWISCVRSRSRRSRRWRRLTR